MTTTKKYPFYLGGKFMTSTDEIEVINPYDKSIVGITYRADEKILEQAIKAAQKVQKELKELPVYKKYQILQDIAHGLLKNIDKLALILARESGKPLVYAKGEIERSIQCFLIASEECKRLPDEYMSLDWTSTGKNKEAIVKHYPIGLIAGIAPFNFPMNLAVHKIAPAIASACPIILKPSTSTPLSTLLLAEIIANTDLPKGAISILPMDRKTGDKLVTDKRFNLLTFTGSPAIGWDMKARAGKKKVVLELGGNAGVIVGTSANIDYAVERTLIGAFSYSGQVCIHAQRIYVAAEIFDKFIDKFITAAKNLVIGDPEDEKTDLATMIDEKNAIRIASWVNEAVKEGAKLLLGGKRDGVFYPATVLTNTNNTMKVCFLEAFGPIVSIEKFTDLKEAIAEVNDSDFGLQAGIFTDSNKEINYAIDHLEAGGVIINDIPTFRVDHMPYGGVKDSGLGREGIKYAMRDMLEPKVIVLDKSEHL